MAVKKEDIEQFINSKIVDNTWIFLCYNGFAFVVSKSVVLKKTFKAILNFSRQFQIEADFFSRKIYYARLENPLILQRLYIPVSYRTPELES